MIYLSFLWHVPPAVFLESNDPRMIATARKLVREMERAQREAK